MWKMVLCVVAIGLLAGQAWAEPECRAMIEQKCGYCHFVNRLCPKLEKKKGAWTWKRTIKDMVDHGMMLTDDETKQLVGCLAKPDDGVMSLCSKKK